MNRKTMLIVGGVVALAIIAGAVLFVMKDDDSSPASQSNSSSQNTNPAENKITEEDNLKEQGNLFTMSGNGKTRQCDMSYSGPSGSGTGKMYTDGKGRGLMTLSFKSEQGSTGQSNTLVTGDKVYSWTASGGQTFGFVFDKDKFTADTSGSGTGSTSADPNQDFSLDCKDWKVEETKLTVPANVNFSSLPS